MIDDRRAQMIECVEREFIGPDPIDLPGCRQKNGEEILKSDPPHIRYCAGILFPRATFESNCDAGAEESFDLEFEDTSEWPDGPQGESQKLETVDPDYLKEAEELINLSNAYRQSAFSITVAVPDGDSIMVEIEAGTYRTVDAIDSLTGKKVTEYHRTQLTWNNDERPVVLPDIAQGLVRVPTASGRLMLGIAFRYKVGSSSIYTFTLENATVNDKGSIRSEECFFQTKMRLLSTEGFAPLPEGKRVTKDDDYYSNMLLYRDVRSYAVGHGCAADWEDGQDRVGWISSAVFPRYEMKPIIPSAIDGVELEMLKMSPHGDFEQVILGLKTLCSKYNAWIDNLEAEVKSEDGLDEEYAGAPSRHINNCRACLARMRSGIELLESDANARTAFQYMNLVMLMQQLHYNLPLQRWEDDGAGGLRLASPIAMPKVLDKSTWHDAEHKVYGKWRPFQLAFILMNLHSMCDKAHPERKIVDLIWFPTGGGKTEAYLGLSAFTIFIRRLRKKDDAGTAILMRYTLRLLTAQQYERAASMICACEVIRSDHEDLFGKSRITIGLWVGGDSTPNHMGGADGAVKKYDKLKSSGKPNPFVIHKCPWCGAQMGPVRRGEIWEVQGYRKETGARKKKWISFRCHNVANGCAFTEKSSPLPMFVVDDSIYENRPTLLLGTVDKFATLPFRPEARSLFGGESSEISPPDLIIQDELHLISGPLGSMVGHYETLVNELCKLELPSGEIVGPKVIASTATISRAKEQCHALYGCDRDKVFQFPPSGLVARDSFFAEENKEGNGREYVGILATGSPSDSTTAIRLFAALLYGAKALNVEEESQRDPYWTNIGYFNSLRELGQAATWIRADIDQHLNVMYKRRRDDLRYETKEEYRNSRRYIWRAEELTSRISGSDVTSSLGNLSIAYPPEMDELGKVVSRPIDICLATNMISVGLDVSRLGLMTVSGQPKTTSEYIQATSRVGRNAGDAPGVVFVIYRPGRPRDKSHYEHFRPYHSRIYCGVEPTSVTPFSSPVRERALHAIMVGLLRLTGDDDLNAGPPNYPTEGEIDFLREVIERRVEEIDPDELDATLAHVDYVLNCWKSWRPTLWTPDVNYDGSYGNRVPLLFVAGSHRHEQWGARGFETMMSMRSVDPSCEAGPLTFPYSAKEEE